VPGLRQVGLSHAFPAASVLADADLSGLGLTRAREEAIRSFSRAVNDDRIRLDGSVGLDELAASITAIDGLGSWTAHYLALRIGEHDAFPITDLGLRRALARPAPRSRAALEELADRWRPWRALAATHLWIAEASGQLARPHAA
jgi:AraC family transcriptional regulator of adaptative response / DNA-3-methyladenine glycosylase II